MKTEPTEALSKLSRVGIVLFNCMYEPETEIIDKDTARQLIISAFSEGQSSPKINQLEWEKGDGEYWEAITPIGAYSITLDFGVYVALYDMDNDVDGEWRSLAKAKAAAQADFEKRVKECFE